MKNSIDANHNLYVLLKNLRLIAFGKMEVPFPEVTVKPDFDKYSDCCDVSELREEYEAELNQLLRKEIGVATQEDVQAKLTEVFDLLCDIGCYRASDEVENLAAIYNKRMEMDTDDIRDCEEMLDLIDFEEDVTPINDSGHVKSLSDEDLLSIAAGGYCVACDVYMVTNGNNMFVDSNELTSEGLNVAFDSIYKDATCDGLTYRKPLNPGRIKKLRLYRAIDDKCNGVGPWCNSLSLISVPDWYKSYDDELQYRDSEYGLIHYRNNVGDDEYQKFRLSNDYVSPLISSQNIKVFRIPDVHVYGESKRKTIEDLGM